MWRSGAIGAVVRIGLEFGKMGGGSRVKTGGVAAGLKQGQLYNQGVSWIPLHSCQSQSYRSKSNDLLPAALNRNWTVVQSLQ